jgi:hypothetical protein
MPHFNDPPRPTPFPQVAEMRDRYCIYFPTACEESKKRLRHIAKLLEVKYQDMQVLLAFTPEEYRDRKRDCLLVEQLHKSKHYDCIQDVYEDQELHLISTDSIAD